MGQLPTIKRFLSEDFPTEASWIGTLLFPLNLLLNTIYANLNNGLTISQNMLAQVKTLSVSGSSPTTTFNWNYPNAQPIGITLVQCLQTDSPAKVITAATSVAWSYAGGVITINNVAGLSSGHTYSCTFIVWGG